MTRTRSTFLVALVLALAGPAGAAEHEVRMLNFVQGEAGPEYMLFEPSFLRVTPGDTVHFVPVDFGHNTVSKVVPAGADPWASELGQPFSVTLEREGVYVYACEPHLAMAMVGVIQVGAPSNLEAAREQAQDLAARAVMNHDRIERYLANVTP